MSGHESYVRVALSTYKYSDMAKREILDTLSTFTDLSDLRPQLSTHVFNDGNTKELLCLDGTIPVIYKGNTYNIPICLLLDTHPYNPPMVFVKPTSSMQIKLGRHVDYNGRIYLPYLHEWNHPQSDLIGLIQILTCVFGEEPPVFTKSKMTPVMPVPPPYLHPRLPASAAVASVPAPKICVVCMERACDRVALYPCGHACFCRVCCEQLRQLEPSLCPMCRKTILNLLPIFD